MPSGGFRRSHIGTGAQIADGTISARKFTTDLQSDNYDGGGKGDPGTKGWYIGRADGFAEFEDALFRGFIEGSTITGTLFRTAESGERLEITQSEKDRIKFFDSTDTAVGFIGYSSLDDVLGIRTEGFKAIDIDMRSEENMMLAAKGTVTVDGGGLGGGPLVQFRDGVGNVLARVDDDVIRTMVPFGGAPFYEENLSSQSNFSFNVPPWVNHITIEGEFRLGGGHTTISLRFNGDSGSNYRSHVRRWDGSGAGVSESHGQGATSLMRVVRMGFAGTAKILIPDVKGGQKKSAQGDSFYTRGTSGASQWISQGGGFWDNGAAITNVLVHAVSETSMSGYVRVYGRP